MAGVRRGTILVFLDAHCKPVRGAIERLADDVAMLNGQAVVAPRIAALDESTWENHLNHCGNGYLLDLETFEERWVRLKTLRRYRSFYASPTWLAVAWQSVAGCSRSWEASIRGCAVGAANKSTLG